LVRGRNSGDALSFQASAGLRAVAFIAATTVLALLKAAMVDAGAFALADLHSGLPFGRAKLMFSFFRFANFNLFVFQLLACCLLAWWTIGLARAIGEKAPLARRPEWYGSVWCWPVANLWLPFQGLRELWQQTGRYTRRARWLLGSAWAAWAAHQILCILGALPFEPRDTAGQSWLILVWLVRDAVFVGGSLLGIMVVVWLTAVHAGSRAAPNFCGT
jgi:hypothetical protein